jgi:hypothetical protein
MAHYCNHDITYKGGVVRVPLRYGIYSAVGGAGPMEQLEGQFVELTPQATEELKALAERECERLGCSDGGFSGDPE